MDKKRKMSRDVKEKAKSAVNAFKPKSMKHDPLGSYTGRPKDKDEKPVQDADDL